MIRLALSWKTAIAVLALTWPALSHAMQVPQSAADICETGDVTRMTKSATRNVDYSGTWVLDLSRSERLPAYWRNAREVIMTVKQDAERITPDFRVVGPKDTMAYTVLSYRLDGSVQNTRSGDRGQVNTAYGLRYADEGKSVVLRSIDSSVVQDVELVNELTQRFELGEAGRSLVVCRTLKSRLTRTVSKLVFKRK